MASPFLPIMHYTLLLVAYTVADGHNATRRREYCRVLCLSYTALVDYGESLPVFY